MHARRPLFPMAICGVLLFSIAATRSNAARSHATSVTHRAPVACTLLTNADATKALEVPSRPGKELVNSTGCIWWSDPAESDTSRRVTLVTHSLTSFRVAMHPAITTIKVEPVSGIGDEAFYQIYPHDQNPFIWVRKGDVTFDVRIITRLDPKPFTLAQEKAKDAVLAKAAVAKL